MADATKKMADSAGADLTPARKRRGPVVFFREVWREGVEKVTWPTWKETYLTTIMVFIMVGLTMVFFFFVDWLLSMGERLLLGSIT